jgi:hypothetical protein
VKRVITTPCNRNFRSLFHLWPRMLQQKNGKALARRKIAWRKTTKIGRERPHFSACQPPKKFFGVAPALGTHTVPPFFAAQENLEFGS